MPKPKQNHRVESATDRGGRGKDLLLRQSCSHGEHIRCSSARAELATDLCPALSDDRFLAEVNAARVHWARFERGRAHLDAVAFTTTRSRSFGRDLDAVRAHDGAVASNVASSRSIRRGRVQTARLCPSAYMGRNALGRGGAWPMRTAAPRLKSMQLKSAPALTRQKQEPRACFCRRGVLLVWFCWWRGYARGRLCLSLLRPLPWLA